MRRRVTNRNIQYGKRIAEFGICILLKLILRIDEPLLKVAVPVLP